MAAVSALHAGIMPLLPAVPLLAMDPSEETLDAAYPDVRDALSAVRPGEVGEAAGEAEYLAPPPPPHQAAI